MDSFSLMDGIAIGIILIAGASVIVAWISLFQASNSSPERIKRLSAKAQAQRRQQQTKKEREQQLEKTTARAERVRAEEVAIQQAILEKQTEFRNQKKLSQWTPPSENNASTATGWLHQGLSKTRERLSEKLGHLILGRKEINSAVFNDLESLLLEADIGPETTDFILNSLKKRFQTSPIQDGETLKQWIREEILRIFEQCPNQTPQLKNTPTVWLLVGVNGVGKTTTIGKLASHYIQQGKRVLVGAGDTFRAAAVEQLAEWSQRAGCDIVSKNPGTDPAAVIYATVHQGVEQGYDLVICDTAGRLHTKKNLMEELRKMIRVIQKLVPEAPHEVLLVLDATTGQNAIVQTREFLEVAPITGLVVTKLDGTAKGGVVIGIVNEFKIPIRYIGVGESIESLRPFEASLFVDSLFSN